MAFDLDDEENKATRKMNGASKERKDENMDIEVGEYVRTKDGKIDKVIIEYNGKCNNSNCSEKHISCKYNYYNEKDVVKHSKQLIDLVEVGDVLEIRTGLHSSFKYFVENEDNLLLLKEKVKEFWNIETILTKEQYMANCYLIRGE